MRLLCVQGHQCERLERGDGHSKLSEERFLFHGLVSLPFRAPSSRGVRRLERTDVLAPMARDCLQALQDRAPTAIADDQARDVRVRESTRGLYEPRLQLAHELCELTDVLAGQATDGPGVHLIDRGIDSIRFATGQHRLHALNCRLMPPHQVAQNLARSPYSNLDRNMAAWPVEVGQSGFDALLQIANQGFDFLTRCHDRNSSLPGAICNVHAHRPALAARRRRPTARYVLGPCFSMSAAILGSTRSFHGRPASYSAIPRWASRESLSNSGLVRHCRSSSPNSASIWTFSNISGPLLREHNAR